MRIVFIPIYDCEDAEQRDDNQAAGSPPDAFVLSPQAGELIIVENFFEELKAKVGN